MTSTSPTTTSLAAAANNNNNNNGTPSPSLDRQESQQQPRNDGNASPTSNTAPIVPLVVPRVVRSPAPIDCNFDDTIRSSNGNATNNLLPIGEEAPALGGGDSDLTPRLTTPLVLGGANNNNNNNLSGGGGGLVSTSTSQQRWGSGFLDRMPQQQQQQQLLERKDSMTIGNLLRKQSFGGQSQGVATTTGATNGSNSTIFRLDTASGNHTVTVMNNRNGSPSAPNSSRSHQANNNPNINLQPIPLTGGNPNGVSSRYGSFNFGTTATNPQSMSPPSLAFGNGHFVGAAAATATASSGALPTTAAGHLSFAPSPDPAVFYRVRNTAIPAANHATLVEVMQHLLDDYPALAPSVRRMIAASQVASQAFLTRANLNETQAQYEQVVANFSAQQQQQQQSQQNASSPPSAATGNGLKQQQQQQTSHQTGVQSNNNNNNATATIKQHRDANTNPNQTGSPVHFVVTATNNNNNAVSSNSGSKLAGRDHNKSSSPTSGHNNHNNHNNNRSFGNFSNNSNFSQGKGNNNNHHHNTNAMSNGSGGKRKNSSDEDNIRDDVSNSTPSSVSLNAQPRFPGHINNNNNNNNNNNSRMQSHLVNNNNTGIIMSVNPFSANNNNNYNNIPQHSHGSGMFVAAPLLPTPPMALDGIHSNNNNNNFYVQQAHAHNGNFHQQQQFHNNNNNDFGLTVQSLSNTLNSNGNNVTYFH